MRQSIRPKRTGALVLLLALGIGTGVWLWARNDGDRSAADAVGPEARDALPDTSPTGGEPLVSAQRALVAAAAVDTSTPPSATPRAVAPAAALRDASPSREPLVMRFAEGPVTIAPDLYELDGDALRIYHAPGVLAEAGRWDGEHKQGVWEYYHENGRLALRSTYVNGLCEGENRAWDANGNLRAVGMTSAGRYHGRVDAWHEDGSVDHEQSGHYVRGQKRR